MIAFSTNIYSIIQNNNYKTVRPVENSMIWLRGSSTHLMDSGFNHYYLWRRRRMIYNKMSNFSFLRYWWSFWIENIPFLENTKFPIDLDISLKPVKNKMRSETRVSLFSKKEIGNQKLESSIKGKKYSKRIYKLGWAGPNLRSNIDISFQFLLYFIYQW